jgi:hypothetical protein
MIMFGSSLPSALGWLVATKVYSGTGADIVMESISPTTERAHERKDARTNQGFNSQRSHRSGFDLVLL